MFIPFKADVAVLAKPVTIYWIIGLNVLFYLAVLTGVNTTESFVLDGYNLSLFSSGFMHGGFFHLFFNMFYLYIFGSAVCSKVGNATFPLIYFTLIILAAVTHLVVDGDPAVGASGAVCGVIGFYLFLYPKSKIKCMWTVVGLWGETFSITASWLIGFWIVKDLFGAIYGTAPIAYAAHLGGFAFGIIAGWVVLKLNWIKRDCEQPNLKDIMS